MSTEYKTRKLFTDKDDNVLFIIWMNRNGLLDSNNSDIGDVSGVLREKIEEKYECSNFKIISFWGNMNFFECYLAVNKSDATKFFNKSPCWTN